MNKINRFHLVLIGCIAHAIVIRMLANQMDIATSDHTQSHFEPPIWMWATVFFSWPVWSIPLWHCGRKRGLAVIIPIVVGLVILWPMVEEVRDGVIFILGLNSGSHT